MKDIGDNGKTVYVGVTDDATCNSRVRNAFLNKVWFQ